jgi:hypothetical protein
MFRQPKLHVLINRPRFVEGHPFDFGLGGRLLQELGSSTKGPKNPTTHISTPKSMEEVVVEVM